ncbi:hypothetical protein [Mucilaginibacter sp. FT3.2]|uniref:hypothetical protein n=1 Tax=Mucilaginibacter sp. FT3.2 TaxID=2723090 RepID=UPI00161F8555|nr:hypothetical protein [Mucilaginibacter sp. FT3.2]MBB6229612.1 hypothetical protein [Mucilaginibacter sp. FT3.2]
MTVVQIKSEIQKALEQVPETALQNILDYVKQRQTQSPDQINLARNLERIISEDDGLLQRLAQ